LTIAIMTLIPYNYFLSRIERSTREIEKFASSLELTFERQRNRAGGSAPKKRKP